MTFPADVPHPLPKAPASAQSTRSSSPTQEHEDRLDQDQLGGDQLNRGQLDGDQLDQDQLNRGQLDGDRLDGLYEQLQAVQRVRVSDGETSSILSGSEDAPRVLVVVLPQLGDFDSLEYAGWLQRSHALFTKQQVAIHVVGIGDRISGQQFCQYTGLPSDRLWVDPTAALHRQLGLYAGLTLKFPGLGAEMTAWMNLMLMCAGIGSPGTLAEVLRGYQGDRQSPQLIAADETIQLGPITLQGNVFDRAGGRGFLRPFELATLRLRNMIEVLGHWSRYVPDGSYLTQRGGTFLFERTSGHPQDSDASPHSTPPTSQLASKLQNQLQDQLQNQLQDQLQDQLQNQLQDQLQNQLQNQLQDKEQYKLQYIHRDRAVLGFAANMANPLDFLHKLDCLQETA
jgi:hypothetical protein